MPRAAIKEREKLLPCPWCRVVPTMIPLGHRRWVLIHDCHMFSTPEGVTTYEEWVELWNERYVNEG